MAILSHELAHDAALLNVTVPRLIAAGRFACCRDAVVDHIVHLRGLDAVAFVSFCALEWAADLRSLPQSPISKRAAIYNSLAGFYWCAVRHPLDMIRLSQSAKTVRLSDRFRIFVVGIGVGFNRLKADVKYHLNKGPQMHK